MPGRFLTPVPVAETQGLIFLGWSGTQAHHHCLGLLSTPADAESSLRLHCIFHLGPGGGCLALAFCWGSPPLPLAGLMASETVYIHQVVKGAQGSKPVLPQPIQGLPSWAVGLRPFNSVYYNFGEMI